MSRAMSGKYITKVLDTIFRDSNEYKAYNLGMAVAYSHLYEYIKKSDGQELADKTINSLANTKEPYGEMLKEIVALGNKEPKTNAEKLAERMYECKNISTTSSNKQIKEDALRDLERRILSKMEGDEVVNGYWLIGFLSYAINEILNESR